MLVNSDSRASVKWLEGDSFSLDIRGYVSEIKEWVALIEWDGTNIFNHGKVIVVNGDREWFLIVDSWAMGTEEK